MYVDHDDDVVRTLSLWKIKYIYLCETLMKKTLL